MATLYVYADDAAATAAGKNAGEYYTSIQAAVNAAADGDRIEIAAGTYDEKISLTSTELATAKALTISGDNAGDVYVLGGITIGDYTGELHGEKNTEKTTGALNWNAPLTVENIIFQMADKDDRVVISYSAGGEIDFVSCDFIAPDDIDGWNPIDVPNSKTNNGGVAAVDFEECKFENGTLNLYGGKDYDFAGCEFTNTRINKQNPGGELTITGTTFNNTITADDVDDSFYCVRSDDIAVVIKDSTFNIDVDENVTADIANQKKWGILWQRKEGNTGWTVNDIEVNLSDAAEESGLLLNKNDTTNADNAAGRITINGLTSTDNDVADLLAKSGGTMVVVETNDDGAVIYTSTYANGVKVATVASDICFIVDQSITADNGETVVINGITYTVGKNAFTTISGAVAAAQDGATIEICSDIEYDAQAVIDVNKKITICGAETQDSKKYSLTNVRFNANQSFKVAGLSFYGDSFIVTGGSDDMSLTVEDCYAEVNASKITGRSAFIVTGTGESTRKLDLVVKNNTILSAQSSKDFFSAAIFGWNYLGDVEISGNTFGSESNEYNFVAVKLMNAQEGGNFIIDNNTVYATNQNWHFSAFDLYQNCSRANNYTAVLGNNSVINGNTDASDYAFKIVYVESNGTGNASVQVLDNNKINGNNVTIDDIEIDKGTYDYVGAGIVVDADGKITGGTFVIGEQGKSALIDDLAPGLVPVDADADGIYELQPVDYSTIYVDASFTKDNVGEGMLFGANAFSSIYDALALAEANTSVKRIELLSDIDASAEEDRNFEILQDMSIGSAAGKKYQITARDFQICILAQNNNTITYEKNLIFDQMGQIIGGYNTTGHADIYGDIKFSQIDSWADNSVITVHETAHAVGKGSDAKVQFVRGKFVVNGSLTATDDEALKNASMQLKAGYFGTHGNGTAYFDFNNAYVEAGSKWTNEGNNLYVDMAGSVLKISGGDEKGKLTLQSTNSGSFVLNGDSRLIVSDITIATKNVIEVNDSSLEAATITNNGTITVSGESTINGGVDGEGNVKAVNVSGSGKIYLQGATLDENTAISGETALFRVVSGTNSITDSKLVVKAFQVGDKNESSYLDKTNGSNVTLSGDAVLNVKGNDSDGSFGGWIGTGWREKDEYGDFAETNTARYKLTVTDNAVATFDYLHVAADGELYVNSKGEYKPEADNGIYAFYANRLLANGKVEFNDTSVRLLSVYVSLDNPMSGDYAGELSFVGSSAKVMGYDGIPTFLNVCNYGVLKVNGGSAVTVYGDMDVAENATVNIAGSSLTLLETTYYEKYRPGKLTNAGTITIDATSLITANYITGSGAITVDATDFSGVKTIIDVNEAGDLSKEKITLTGVKDGENTKLVQKDDGDIVLVNVDTSNIIVNGSFTDQDAVDAYIGVDSEISGVYLGANAFDNLTDAVAAADNDAKINVSGELSGKAVFADGKNLTVTGNATLTWDDGFFFIGRGADNAVATTVTFQNAVIDSKKPSGSHGFNVGQAESAATQKADGTLIVDNSAIVVGYLQNRNVVNVKGDGIADGVYGYGTEGKANLHVTNYFAVSRDNNDDTKNAEMNLTDGAYVKIDNENGAGIAYDGRGILSITESKFEATQSLTNKGTISVTKGILNVAKKLTNDGTITVSGESTLNIRELSGSNSIDLLDGAIIKDSTVGGKVYVDGKVTFRGKNEFGSMQDFGPTYYFEDEEAVNNRDWTIEAGASVKLTQGAQMGFGYGDKVTVNGKLTNAKIAYESGLTTEDAALIAAGGIIAQGAREATSTFTVQDAYVRIGIDGFDKSFKNDYKDDNYGTYNFNWSNSVVEVNSFIFKNSENGAYNFDLTNSVFKTGGQFDYTDVNSTFTASNSKVISTGTEGVHANDGTMIFKDGSTVDWAHNFTNNGSIEVSGTNTVFEADSLTNFGTIKVADGATFNADYLFTNKAKISTQHDLYTEYRYFTVVTYDKKNNEIGRQVIDFRRGESEETFGWIPCPDGGYYKFFYGDEDVTSKVTVGEIEKAPAGSAFTAKGEVTLNIGTLNGNSIDLLDGAIVKNSTVGGAAFIAGNVTFRGDNSFTMITDFGTLTDRYGTTAPMAWTVEAGASLTLTEKARYGLGYGDKVVINGNIAEGGAAAARATLTDDDVTNDVKQSLFMHGLVAQESQGWNCDSSFTVNSAFVTIGENSSFGNKPGNYGGTYTFRINNSVVNSSRITFYEALSKTAFTFKDSDVKIGQFMTRDKDSVFTLDNTTLLSTSISNGNDEGNYNAGTLNVINGSTLTYSIKMSNEATGIINVNNATLVAPEVDNKGTITVSADSTVTIAGTLTNNGTIELALGATFEVGGFAGTGTITVDSRSYVEGAVQVINYTGTANITEEDYKSIIGKAWSNAFSVVDGDLFYNRDNATHKVENTDTYIIPDGTALVVVDPGDDATLNHATTNFAANGVEAVVKSGTFKDTVSGGAIVSSRDYKTWEDYEFVTNLTVEGGTFDKIVMGGSRVDKGSSEQIGDSNLTITGGTFNFQIAGGMAYADDSIQYGQARLTGDVNLTISGGEINSWVYGGSISRSDRSNCTLIIGDITIKIDASSNNAITFGDNSHIVAGSYQYGVVEGNTKVVFTGLSENLGIDDDNLVWGGCSADVYINGADGSRTFQTNVHGDRTISFDAFSGDFTARIRGFNTLDAVNGAEVTALAGNLSDIEFWNFDTESSIAGSFVNDFAGDTFDVELTTGWDGSETTLFSGDVTGFEDMTVTLGGEIATWDLDAEISRYASSSYQLTFDAENKVVKFGLLA